MIQATQVNPSKLAVGHIVQFIDFGLAAKGELPLVYGVSPVLHNEPRQKFSELMFPDKGAEIARELAHRTEPYVIIDAEFGKAHLINPNPQEN